MKYSKRRDKYCCDVLNENFHEIDERLNNLEDGPSSEDGFSPIAKVEQTENGAKITITDKTGTTEAVVKDGEKGDIGPQGPRGPQGIQGIQGVQGEKGDKGDKGDTGEKGDAGASVIHSWEGTKLIITSESGTTSTDLKGEKGDKGDQGETGEQGIQGIQGEKGEPGAKGDKGDTGAQGTTGVGVKSITNYYLATASSSGVTTSTSGWTTTVQNVSSSKKYLWNYERVTMTDDSYKDTTPCIIGAYGDKGDTGAQGIQGETGAKGDKGDKGDTGATGPQGPQGNTGATGKGIKSITEHYAVSTSNTTVPSSWQSTVPTLTATNKYLWNYETITYTDNTSIDTSKRIIGVYGNTGATGATGPQGPQGEKGDKGDTGATGPQGSTGATGKGISSITEYYLASASSSGVTTSTSGWTTTMQSTTTTKKYLWNYEIITYTDGTKYTSTPVIIGTHGATGSTGPQGQQGETGPQGATGATGPQGPQGIQGYSIVASVSRPSFTEANWTTYGEIGHEENWSNTEPTRNGCRIGDIFTVVGTATDTGKAHVLYYQSTTASGTLRGKCIAHSIANRGATGAKGDTGATGAAGKDGQMLYATCSTASGTAAKAATISSGSLTLKDGVSVAVKFTNANTASSPTLNVSSTGAKTIRLNGAALTSSAYYWVANAVVTFVYDGSYWNVADASALSKATEAAKTASNFLSYDADNGLLIGNKTSGSWSGFRTQVTSSAFNILNSAGTALASYGAKLVELGKNATDAVIKLCGGKGQIAYNGDNDYIELTSDNVRVRGDSLASLYAMDSSAGTLTPKSAVNASSNGYILSYVTASNDIDPKEDVGFNYDTSMMKMNMERIILSSSYIDIMGAYDINLDVAQGEINVNGSMTLSGDIEGVTAPSTVSISNGSGTGYTSTIDTNNSKVFTKTKQVFINARSKLVLTETISTGTTITLGKLSNYLPPSVCALSVWQNSTNSRRYMGAIDEGNVVIKCSANLTSGTYYIYFQASYVHN